MGNEVMEKVIQLAMENAELRTKIEVLHNVYKVQKAVAESRGYGATLDLSDIQNIMGWFDD